MSSAKWFWDAEGGGFCVGHCGLMVVEGFLGGIGRGKRFWKDSSGRKGEVNQEAE